MTAHERMIRLCQHNRTLTQQNECLQEKLAVIEQELGDLREANANLRVERDAADVLLGEALDEVLGRREA